MANFWKPTPLMALATALGLLLTGIVMVVYSERSYEAQKTNEVQVQADILASTVVAALVFSDRHAAQEYVEALAANPEVQAAAVYDDAGLLFVAYARAPDHTPPPTAPGSAPRFEGDRVAVVAPVRQGLTSVGTVYIQTITEPLARRLERYGVIALLIIMAALVVGVLGAAHAALTQVNAELERRARELADTNLNLQKQIAERHKAEEALRQAQKMEAIGQLTGGIAHDFNNIMQVILGNLDALRRSLDHPGESSGDALRRWTGAAIRGAERAATLTRQLLAFARRQPLAPKPIEVNKLVTAMSDLLRRTLGETVVTETVLAGGLWRVSADANQLESALLNLAVNARDAMRDGGKLTIETANAHLDERYAAEEEVKPGQYVMLAVTDTGTGMTKEVAAKAFDPFFTTKDIGQGTGLGLSQVYGFVKQSGGHVKIYSEPGEGTTIKLYLPRLVGAENAADSVAERRVPRAAAQEMVLVVEDDDDVRVSTAEMLRHLGYGVMEAADGPSALRMIEARPDLQLLFTDVGLPGGLNGRQLADEACRRRPGLKVLFATGYARNAIVHHGRLDPGVELIGKPFTFAALAGKIRQVLEGVERKT